jgi:hypothetical protein
MNCDELEKLEHAAIPAISKSLNATDILFLVGMLNEKDDKLRYNAFLLLQLSSQIFPFVYEYWGELEKKLDSDNSYQRSLGIMLIAENVRWDKDDRFVRIFSKYLSCCRDAKFITARQAIQGLETILKTTDKFNNDVKRGLENLQLSHYKENQQKLLRKDISNILKIINR